MTLNTAFALALEIAGRIQWPLGVAGALAVAAAIDLITGFSLKIPDGVTAQVEAIQKIDELESQKKAASIDEARLMNARAQEEDAGRLPTADFGAAARPTRIWFTLMKSGYS